MIQTSNLLHTTKSNMENNTYDFEFKMVNGAYSKKYTIEIYWTMKLFLDNIKQQIQQDFPLDHTQADGAISWQKIDIVEAGQYDNVNGRNPELAPALENSEITLSDYFNKRLSTTSFYVR